MKDTTLTKTELRAENERLRAHINLQREEMQLLTCKILTCGVAAEHPNPELSRRAKDYGGPWDSPQAQRVRELRDSRDRLREAVKELARYEELCKRRRYIGA